MNDTPPQPSTDPFRASGSPDSNGIMPPGVENRDLEEALAHVLGPVVIDQTQQTQEGDRIITEPARLAKKVPPEVPAGADNILWRYDGSLLSQGGMHGYDKPVELLDAVDGMHPTVEFNSRKGAIWTLGQLPEGKRLVVDGVPRGNEDNDPQKPPRKIQLHVYRNTHGFLVADEIAEGKVLEDTAIGARTIKDTEDAEPRYALDPDAPHSRPVSTEHLKQRRGTYDAQSGTWNEEVQLLSMTSKWLIGPRQARGEITVSTPDDAGGEVQVTFGRCDQWRDHPLTIRLVPDSVQELHPLLS